jgi:abortive infection bacteriophage resistance protein
VRKKIFLFLDSFNNYFLSVADKLTLNIKNSNNHDKDIDTSPLGYLSQLFSDTLPDIKFRNTSTQEIEKNY